MATRRIDVAPLISAVAPLAEGPAVVRPPPRRDDGLMKVVSS